MQSAHAPQSHAGSSIRQQAPHTPSKRDGLSQLTDRSSAAPRSSRAVSSSRHCVPSKHVHTCICKQPACSQGTWRNMHGTPRPDKRAGQRTARPLLRCPRQTAAPAAARGGRAGARAGAARAPAPAPAGAAAGATGARPACLRARAPPRLAPAVRGNNNRGEDC